MYKRKLKHHHSLCYYQRRHKEPPKVVRRSRNWASQRSGEKCNPLLGAIYSPVNGSSLRSSNFPSQHFLQQRCVPRHWEWGMRAPGDLWKDIHREGTGRTLFTVGQLWMS